MSSVNTDTVDAEHALDFFDQNISCRFHSISSQHSSDVIGVDRV